MVADGEELHFNLARELRGLSCEGWGGLAELRGPWRCRRKWQEAGANNEALK